jgi:ribosomal protein S18 acetylase RimI-like enzyme
MNQTVDISIANENDVHALCQLLVQLFSQELEFTPNIEAHQRGLLSIIRNPSVGFILIGKVKDKAVGMVNILFTVSTALGERVAILEDMVVSDAFRGLGTGSKLLEHAMKEAKKQQCKRITLLTDASNNAAQKFYQKHKFTQSSMLPFRLTLI